MLGPTGTPRRGLKTRLAEPALAVAEGSRGHWQAAARRARYRQSPDG